MPKRLSHFIHRFLPTALGSLLAVIFAFSASPVHAVYYQPGETLDPACAPLDTDCGVASVVGTGVQGQVPYYAANGGVLTATSSITILQNGNVGIGTSTPAYKLSVVGMILADSLTTSSSTATSTLAGNLKVNGALFQNNLPVASSRLSYRGLLFYDDFNRADTAVGVLGISTSGSAYDMRGRSAQSNNAVTRIENGKWVSNADDVTYAIQTLPANVTNMGGQVSWLPGNGGTDPGVFTFIISPDKTGNNLYKNAAVHVLIRRTGYTIQYIDNNSFVTVKTGTFPTTLSDDGRSYPFEFSLNGPVMYYSFAGVTGSVSSPYFVTHAGPYATWEHYYDSASVSDLLRVEAIWAGTNAVSSGTLYDLGSTGLVGIGTSTPTARLEIFGTPSDTITTRNYLRFSSSGGVFIQQGLNASGDLVIDTVFGTAANLMTIKRNGLIGIGTTSPQRKLHVEGSGAQMRLGNNTVAGAYTEFTDATGSFTLAKTALTGISTMDFSPIMSDGVSTGIVRFFRNSTSTAQSQLQIFRGDGTSNITTLFSTNSNSYINALGGNVGIATTTPGRKLTVAGTVGFSGLTTAVGTGSLCLSASGEVVYNASDNCLSSTRETKHSINSLALSELEMLQELNPVSFVYNGDPEERLRYGFIADEADSIDPHLATRNAEGKLTGLDTSGFLALIVGAIQELSESVTTVVLNATTGNFSEKICIGQTCVTESQLQELLNDSGQVPTPPSAPAPINPVEEPIVEEPKADEPLLEMPTSQVEDEQPEAPEQEAPASVTPVSDSTST